MNDNTNRGRIRILEMKNIPAKDLHESPLQWKQHPDLQREQLGAVMDKIGKADVCIVRQVEDGRYFLIDGHLRKSMSGDDELLPCIVTDLDDEEANVMLAVLDPLASMSIADEDSLTALVDKIDDPYMKRIAHEVTDLNWYYKAESIANPEEEAEETQQLAILKIECREDDRDALDEAIMGVLQNFTHVTAKWS